MIEKIRYDYIDIAKAIAIFLMVLLHTTMSYQSLSEYVGAFHMAVFFFIAGMFAKGADMPMTDVLRKAWIQLMIPYFIFSICAFSICWITPYLHPEIYSGFHGFFDIFKGAFIGMFLMQDRVTGYSFMPSGQLWFLPALFLCRIIFMLWIKSEHRHYFKLIILGILFALYYYRISLFSLGSAAISFPFILLGHYTKGIVIKVDPQHKPEIGIIGYLMVSIVALLLIYLLNGHGINFDGACYRGCIVVAYIRGILGIIGLLALSMAICKFSFKKIITYLALVGKATLAILGLHGYFITIFKVIYVLTGHSATSVSIWYALIFSIINVAMCTLIYKYVLLPYFPIIVGKTKEYPKPPIL